MNNESHKHKQLFPFWNIVTFTSHHTDHLNIRTMISIHNWAIRKYSGLLQIQGIKLRKKKVATGNWVKTMHTEWNVSICFYILSLGIHMKVHYTVYFILIATEWFNLTQVIKSTYCFKVVTENCLYSFHFNTKNVQTVLISEQPMTVQLTSKLMYITWQEFLLYTIMSVS
jgi:hypothetical protein